jgi:hypothetical protein
MKVVCVCWNTLDARVREFTKTPTAALTYKEFEVAARMADKEQQLMLEGMVSREGCQRAENRTSYS